MRLPPGFGVQQGAEAAEVGAGRGQSTARLEPGVEVVEGNEAGVVGQCADQQQAEAQARELHESMVAMDAMARSVRDQMLQTAKKYEEVVDLLREQYPESEILHNCPPLSAAPVVADPPDHKSMDECVRELMARREDFLAERFPTVGSRAQSTDLQKAPALEEKESANAERVTSDRGKVPEGTKGRDSGLARKRERSLVNRSPACERSRSRSQPHREKRTRRDSQGRSHRPPLHRQSSSSRYHRRRSPSRSPSPHHRPHRGRSHSRSPAAHRRGRSTSRSWSRSRRGSVSPKDTRRGPRDHRPREAEQDRLERGDRGRGRDRVQGTPRQVPMKRPAQERPDGHGVARAGAGEDGRGGPGAVRRVRSEEGSQVIGVGGRAGSAPGDVASPGVPVAAALAKDGNREGAVRHLPKPATQQPPPVQKAGVNPKRPQVPPAAEGTATPALAPVAKAAAASQTAANTGVLPAAPAVVLTAAMPSPPNAGTGAQPSAIPPAMDGEEARARALAARASANNVLATLAKKVAMAPQPAMVPQPPPGSPPPPRPDPCPMAPQPNLAPLIVMQQPMQIPFVGTPRANIHLGGLQPFQPPTVTLALPAPQQTVQVMANPMPSGPLGQASTISPAPPAAPGLATAIRGSPGQGQSQSQGQGGVVPTQPTKAIRPQAKTPPSGNGTTIDTAGSAPVRANRWDRGQQPGRPKVAIKVASKGDPGKTPAADHDDDVDLVRGASEVGRTPARRVEIVHTAERRKRMLDGSSIFAAHIPPDGEFWSSFRDAMERDASDLEPADHADDSEREGIWEGRRSVLLWFKWARLWPHFQAISGGVAAKSVTYTNAINPFRPICPFELRGSCGDSACQFQHAREWKLSDGAALQDMKKLAQMASGKIGGRGVPGTLTEPGSSRSVIPFSALPMEVVSSLGRRDDQIVTAFGKYMPTYQFRKGIVKERVFKTSLLAPARYNAPGQMRVCRPFRHLSTFEPPDHHPRRQSVGTLARYFPTGSQLLSESQSLVERYEAVKASASEDALLEIALDHIDFGGPAAREPEAKEAVIKLLARILESRELNSMKVWMAYLGLCLSPQVDPKSDALIKQAMVKYPSCYQIGIMAVAHTTKWNAKVRDLQQRLVLQSSVVPEDAGVPCKVFLSSHGPCILDLALRMLQVLCCASQQNVLEIWFNKLSETSRRLSRLSGAEDLANPEKIFQDVSTKGAALTGQQAKCAETYPPSTPGVTKSARNRHMLLVRAASSLLHALDWHPEEAAVYWLSLAYAVACGKLPTRVVHRLGHCQECFPVSWGEEIPTGKRFLTRRILLTAAGGSVGCLDLKDTRKWWPEGAAQARRCLGVSMFNYSSLVEEALPLLCEAFPPLSASNEEDGVQEALQPPADEVGRKRMLSDTAWELEAFLREDGQWGSERDSGSAAATSSRSGDSRGGEPQARPVWPDLWRAALHLQQDVQEACPDRVRSWRLPIFQLMSEYLTSGEPFHDLHRTQSVWTEYVKLALKHGSPEEACEVLSRGAAGLKLLETYTGDDPNILKLLAPEGVKNPQKSLIKAGEDARWPVGAPLSCARTRAAFEILLTPTLRREYAWHLLTLEDGEVMDQEVVSFKEVEVIAGLANLGIYELLTGHGEEARQAFNRALDACGSDRSLRRSAWKEILGVYAVALGPLVPVSGAVTGHATQDTTGKGEGIGSGNGCGQAGWSGWRAESPLLPSSDPMACIPESARRSRARGSCFKIFLHLVQRFVMEECEGAQLRGLELPPLEYENSRVREFLTPPSTTDGSSVVEAVSPLLHRLTDYESAELVGSVCTAMPTSPAAVELLLNLGSLMPQRVVASWWVPLLASALISASPPAAPSLWAEAIDTCRQHCVDSASELCQRACMVHPYCKHLWEVLWSLTNKAAVVLAQAKVYGFQLS
eukprot:evm.model.scf_31.5 EVM.evm.TU.scf_31.5   scf_31:105141-125118(-)